MRPQGEEWDYVVEVWPGIGDDDDEEGKWPVLLLRIVNALNFSFAFAEDFLRPRHRQSVCEDQSCTRLVCIPSPSDICPLVSRGGHCYAVLPRASEALF